MENKNRERNKKLQDELTSEIEGMKPDYLSDPILLSPKTGNYIIRLYIQLLTKWVNDNIFTFSKHVRPIFFIISDGKVLFGIKINTEFPVDLYALIDLSGSMDVYRDNLIKSVEAISETIGEDTTDYRLGFGGFRDKPRPPFGAGTDKIFLY